MGLCTCTSSLAGEVYVGTEIRAPAVVVEMFDLPELTSSFGSEQAQVDAPEYTDSGAKKNPAFHRNGSEADNRDEWPNFEACYPERNRFLGRM